jgi:hypothetical protein
MAMAAMKYDFSGVWRSRYHYVSNRRGPGDFVSEHLVMAQRRGNKLVFQSLPAEDGSFMLVRLTLDGRLASGGWEETSSSAGPFKGARFYGPIQLVLDEDGKAFRGMYLATGQLMHTKAGEWEIVHLSPTEQLHQDGGL